MMNEYIESNLAEFGLLDVYEDYGEFTCLTLKIRANIVAFVQSLNVVADTGFHMLHDSLALHKLPMPFQCQTAGGV